MNEDRHWIRWPTILSTMLLLLVVTRAGAVATLEIQVNATCGVTGTSTTFFECSRGPFPGPIGDAVRFDAVVLPAERAFVDVTLHYVYTDDGFAFGDDPRLDFQILALGNPFRDFIVVQIFNEAGGIAFDGNDCNPFRQCSDFDPNIFVESGGDGPIVLGLNALPDRLEGDVSFSSSVSVDPTYTGGPVSRTIFVNWQAVAFSGIAPVPEPDASFLLVSCLAVGAAWVRRCRAAAKA